MESDFSIYSGSQNVALAPRQTGFQQPMYPAHIPSIQEALHTLRLQNQQLNEKNGYLHSMLCTKEEQLNASSKSVRELSLMVEDFQTTVEKLSAKVKQFTEEELERVKEREKTQSLQMQYDLAVEQRRAACLEATQCRLESQENKRLAELYKNKFEELEKQFQALLQTPPAAEAVSPKASFRFDPVPLPRHSPVFHSPVVHFGPVYAPSHVYICPPQYPQGAPPAYSLPVNRQSLQHNTHSTKGKPLYTRVATSANSVIANPKKPS